MKTLLIASALMAASFAATADHHDYVRQEAASGPSRTRAEVITELQVAKAAGQINISDSEMRAAERSRLQTSSGLTRQQVMQEVIALREQGLFEIQGDH